MTDAPRLAGRLARAAVVTAFFSAAAAAWTWPLVRDAGRTFVHPPGMAGPLAQADSFLTSWIVTWGAHALTSRPASLFDANILHPLRDTLGLSEHLVSGAALVVPLDAAKGNPIANNNLLVLATFVIGGAGTAWLARELGASAVGSLAAGVFAFFGPLRLAQIGHVHALSLHWLPVALALLHRTWRTASNRAALGFTIALALQGLASVYLAYYSALAVALLVALLFATNVRAAAGGRRRVVVAGVAGAAAAAPVMLPYARVVDVYGVARDPAEAFLFAARGVTYLGAFVDPVAHLRQRFVDDGWPIAVVGVGLAVLAATGAVRGAPSRRGGRRVTAAYVVVALAMALLSLGPTMQMRPSLEGGIPGPHRLLAWMLPGFDALRVPLRAAGVVVLALSLLAAFGADAIQARVGPRRRPFVAAALGALLVFESWHPRLAWTRIGDDVLAPARQRWLAARSGREPVVELPYGAVELDAAAMVRRTADWRPLVNGYTGFLPAGYFLRSVLAAFPDARSVGLLAGLGVRWVMVDGAAYARGDRPSPCIAARGTSGVRTAHESVDGCVLEVIAEPPSEPPPAGRRVTPVRMRTSDGAELAVDASGDLATPWSQEIVRGHEGSLEITLPAASVVMRVVLRLGPRFGWYLRLYRLEVSEDGERWRVAREERVADAPLVRYRTRRADLVTMIELPAARVRRLRLVRPAARRGDPPDLWLGWSRWGVESVEIFGPAPGE